MELNDEEDISEMPFFKWGSTKNSAASKEHYKQKTEHKLLLAKQDPEPVFNLTDCNLQEVPSGVYSWCKVCRKEIILLQNNLLRSLNGGGNIKDLLLLRVVDVHNNKLGKLPDEIGALVNLQALYLQFNELKHLPDSFCRLERLQVLNIKGNRFKQIPEVVCRLGSLQKLDVSANVIGRLPNELCNLRALNQLVLDEENYEYPPRDVCVQGLEVIMRFLSKESGAEYSMDANQTECQFDLESQLHYDTSEDTWTKLAHTQDLHQTANLEAEKSLQVLFENLAQVAVETQKAKEKFLEELIHDKDRMDEELELAQNRKDVDRQRLLNELYEVEHESVEALQQLLQMNESRRNTESMLEALERERREFEQLFMTVQSETVVLRRKEVLEAMESILANQFVEVELNSASALDRTERLERTKMETLDFDQKLVEIMTRSGKDQEKLLAEISQEEEIQKKAFAVLMMKRDDEYSHLTEQILLIEQELTNLTLLEVRKQNLRVEFEKHVLEEQREVLTRLLVQLMDRQDGRRREFEKRMDDMEARRTMEESDFWLLQYQRLMDVKPEQIKAQVKFMEDPIRAILHKARAEDYVLLFAKNKVTLAQLLTLEHKDLKRIGIKDVFVREDILRSVESYRNNNAQREGEEAAAAVPSAPPLVTERQESLRTRFETECVVCLDQKCTLLFLNCGHVCCCEECGTPLASCPLCRAQIERAVVLRFS